MLCESTVHVAASGEAQMTEGKQEARARLCLKGRGRAEEGDSSAVSVILLVRLVLRQVPNSETSTGFFKCVVNDIHCTHFSLFLCNDGCTALSTTNSCYKTAASLKLCDKIFKTVALETYKPDSMLTPTTFTKPLN